MELKLSVVVPIYNAAAYLPRCLDSILNQGLEVGEYEVLLIDDGSTDTSSAICRDYQTRYPNVFKVFTQPNSGVSAARNKGIANAHGTYIAFADSDDLLLGGGIAC